MAEVHVRNQLRFPFEAFVGNDLAKRAMVTALSSADIHSILISGPRGTGKSALARSIRDISGDRETVILPLGSTEDQIFGGIDIEKTMAKGSIELSRSLMDRADGNIVVADNANLFPEYVIHQILNAAETGSYSVERDGVSAVIGTRFLFVATMDPEEGGLSDHILDRFDMCVFLSTLDDEDLRVTVAERSLGFQKEPEEFIRRFSDKTRRTTDDIISAYQRARFTRVPDGYCGAISEICNKLNVAGHRGDISVMNAACALAALDGRDVADLDDLKEAAAMCLEHRRNDIDHDERQEHPKENEQEDRENGNERQEDEQDRSDDPGRSEDREPEGDDRELDQQERQQEDDGQEHDVPPPVDPNDMKEQTFEIGDPYKVIDYMPKVKSSIKKGNAGRRNGSLIRDTAGRTIGYCIPRGKATDIAFSASIRAAAPYQKGRDHSGLAIVLKKEDLREKVREKRQGNDILFLVDGSGSIGAQKRMIAVKGAILSMLKDAYQKRDRIGMAVFRMDRSEEILPLTKSILKAYNVLQDIPTGGRTPLTHGLLKGYEILKNSSSDGASPVMVILSDGRCNVPYTAGTKPVDEMLSTARSLSKAGIRFIVIDTEAGRLKFGLAMELCQALNGTYLRLEDLNAEFLERSVNIAMQNQ